MPPHVGGQQGILVCKGEPIMSKAKSVALERSLQLRDQKPLLKRMLSYRDMYLMMIPGLAFLLLFQYGPMYGVVIAFKEYNIIEGIWGSPWVGLANFEEFFSSAEALQVLKNTIIISFLRLAITFPVTIIVSLMINEVSNNAFKRVIQTISYLPHFMSWVIVAGIVINVLSPSTGIINAAIKALGGEPIYFMTSNFWFRPVLVLSSLWKEVGWGTVLYLAAVSNVDAEQYEAAIVDGATRFQRIRHITLPALYPVMTIQLILSMGTIMNAGFDQVFNLYNEMVYETGDIIDTFVYRKGLVEMNYSFSTAVGLFKSVVGLILTVSVHLITRRINGGEFGLW